jgi:hypothetical protein
MSDDWETDADRAEEAELERLGHEERIDALGWTLGCALGLLREAVDSWDAGTLTDGNRMGEWVAKARELFEPEGKGEEKP